MVTGPHIFNYDTSVLSVGTQFATHLCSVGCVK